MPRLAWIGWSVVAFIIIAALAAEYVHYFSPLERCVRQVEEEHHTDDAVARGQCLAR